MSISKDAIIPVSRLNRKFALCSINTSRCMYGIKSPPPVFEFIVNVGVSHHSGSNYNGQVISCEVDITGRRNEKATRMYLAISAV